MKSYASDEVTDCKWQDITIANILGDIFLHETAEVLATCLINAVTRNEKLEKVEGVA